MLVRWHRWIALVFALPLLVQIVTGLALVYKGEITGGREAGAYASARVSFAESISAVRAVYPAYRLLRTVFPAEPGRAYVFHLEPSSGAATAFVEVDPASGRVLGELGTAARIFDVALEIHDNLATPGWGMFVVALSGCALLFLAVSGLIMWWPGVGKLGAALRWPRRGPARQLLFLWHQSLGAVAGLLLVVLTVLGIPLALNSILTTTPWQTPAPMPISATADARLAAARALFPHLSVRDVRFGANGTIERVLLHKGAYGRRGPVSQVRFDAYSGAMTGIVDARRLSPGDTFMVWLYPLHSGQAGGLIGRSIVFVVGLTAAIIGATGVALWWVRRPGRTR